MSKICVVGGGRWGQNHIKTLKSMECEVDVVDPVVEVKYRCLSEVSMDEYDGFVVAAPAEEHYGLGKHILDRGKPVLIEKPVALNLADAKALVETDQTVMAGHLFLFHPAIEMIKWMLPSLGDIRFIHSKRLNFGNVRTAEDIIWTERIRRKSFAISELSYSQVFRTVLRLRFSTRTLWRLST